MFYETCIKELIGKPEYQTLLEKCDATHLVTEITTGSSIDVIVEYEHTSQENRKEIESVLSEALESGSRKLNSAKIQLSQRTENIRTDNLRISIKGSLKKTPFLGNVSLILIGKFSKAYPSIFERFSFSGNEPDRITEILIHFFSKFLRSRGIPFWLFL